CAHHLAARSRVLDPGPAGSGLADALFRLTAGHGLAEIRTTEQQQEELACEGVGPQGPERIMLQQCRGQQYPIGDSHHQRTDDRSQKDVHAPQRKPDQQRQTSEQAKVSQHTTQSFLCLCYRAVNITPGNAGNKPGNAQVTVLNMQKSNLVMTGVKIRLSDLLP